MKETGIIMSGNHPRLIQDGLKTMTRRTWGLEKVNENPDDWSVIEQPVHWSFYKHNEPDGDGHFIPLNIKCPYGGAGDLLWVKETHYRYGGWAVDGFTTTGRPSWKFQPLSSEVKYLDNPPAELCKNRRGIGWWRRPSLFMPKAFARIWLPITGLRAERLQEITEADAQAEGFGWYCGHPDCLNGRHWARGAFIKIWDSLNAKRGYSWDFNPWVWPISFKEVKSE